MIQKALASKVNIYIHGWKGLAKYYGVHMRTLQRWHAKLRVPWEKSGLRKKDPVRIHVMVADAYYKISKN